jgi:hypothetical protein
MKKVLTWGICMHWKGIEFTAHNFHTSSFYHMETFRCLVFNIVNNILVMARDVYIWESGDCYTS